MITKDGGGGKPLPQVPLPSSPVVVEVDEANVVSYAVTFQGEADRFRAMLRGVEEDLTVVPWLGDPVAAWAAERFNEHYTKLIVELTKLREQYEMAAVELKATAGRYGLTDEVNKALMESGQGG
ncbi:MAG: hypothetical protein M3548_04485 [Actinomycetota bacterium]|nr:hypothetical protein [Actinomycetota bacterium]